MEQTKEKKKEIKEKKRGPWFRIQAEKLRGIDRD